MDGCDRIFWDRISKNRVTSFINAKEEEMQNTADRIGDAAYIILELQRFFVLDSYQEEVKNIYGGSKFLLPSFFLDGVPLHL